jgi:hypothetical protein
MIDYCLFLERTWFIHPCKNDAPKYDEERVETEGRDEGLGNFID